MTGPDGAMAPARLAHHRAGLIEELGRAQDNGTAMAPSAMTLRMFPPELATRLPIIAASEVSSSVSS